MYQGGDYGDDDVSEFCDTVTGISEVDHIAAHYYDQQDTNVMTGNKSAAFLSKNKRSPASSILRKTGAMSPRHKNIKKHYSPTFIPEYIMDTWTDSVPNNRCSIVFLVESGADKHKELDVRISTDGLSLVITNKMSEVALNPTLGIKSNIIRKDRSFELDKVKASLLDNHGRVTGRKATIAHICNREVSRDPQINLTARLPLPFKCRKTFARKDDGDSIFFGKKFVKFPDQSVWCVCEMISHVTDEYKTMDDIDEEEVVINIVNDHFNHPTTTSPSTKRSHPTEQKNTSSSSNFSIGTIESGSRKGPITRSAARAMKRSASSTSKDEVDMGKETTPKKNNSSATTGRKYTYPNTTLDPKVVEESVYLSPSSSNGTTTFFSTSPDYENKKEEKKPAEEITCKVRTEQRILEKAIKMLTGNFDTQTFVSNDDDDETTFSHTSKAMKMMTTAASDNKSLGTLSEAEISTISKNLRKLGAAEKRIDEEIEDINENY